MTQKPTVEQLVPLPADEDACLAALHRQIEAWLPLVRDLPQARKVRWSVDVDPQEL